MVHLGFSLASPARGNGFVDARHPPQLADGPVHDSGQVDDAGNEGSLELGGRLARCRSRHLTGARNGKATPS